jgi:hypothetical protein
MQMKTEAEETYANGRTLENAKEVVRQMKSDADKEYHNGVAKRTELRQWPTQRRQLIAYRVDMTIMRLSELKLAMGTVAISMLMARAGGLEFVLTMKARQNYGLR